MLYIYSKILAEFRLPSSISEIRTKCKSVASLHSHREKLRERNTYF